MSFFDFFLEIDSVGLLFGTIQLWLIFCPLRGPLRSLISLWFLNQSSSILVGIIKLLVLPDSTNSQELWGYLSGDRGLNILTVSRTSKNLNFSTNSSPIVLQSS